MKLLLPFILIFSTSVYAFQDSTARMPPEVTKPTHNWWWLIGVVLAIAAGMLLYVLIKKDPRKDAAD
jgi:phosphotransferase system  glucose/maltose/N-acetylglucosamine-specific IIC component